MANSDVIIAGAGFAGLALALALRSSSNRSLGVALVDRVDPRQSANPDADGRASALSAASRNLLEVLGIWQHLAPRAQPITEIDITDGKLESPLRQVFLHYDNTLDDGDAASHVVENRHLKQALLEALSNDPEIALHIDQGITNYHPTASNVDLELASAQKLDAKLLVAADGRRSHLRKLAGIKSVAWSYDQSGIVTTVTHEKPHNGRAVQHFLPAGPFAILPLPGNRSSLVWTEERTEADRIMHLDDAEFLQELEQRFGHRLGALDLAGPRAAWPLDLSVARRFIADRLVLVGDAAHGVHPIAGQGFNIALRDVAALTEVIIDAQRLGLDIGAGAHLEHYQRWRRFDSLVSGLTFDGINRLFSNDVALVRTARDVGLGLVDRMPGLKRFFVQEAAGLTGDVPKLLRGERV